MGDGPIGGELLEFPEQGSIRDQVIGVCVLVRLHVLPGEARLVIDLVVETGTWAVLTALQSIQVLGGSTSEG